MGSKKEKKPSIEELARNRIVNLYQSKGEELLLICDARVKWKLDVFAAFHKSGITLYEYNETYENKIIKLETHRWDEWDDVLIDHYFITSTLDFKGSNGSWSITITTDRKKAQQVIDSVTDIQVETVLRPWYRKIVGYRSQKTWKMITATLIYAIFFFSLLDRNTPKQLDGIIANIAIIAMLLAILGLFIGIINPKFVLPFTARRSRKRVGKMYGTSILLAFIMAFIFIPVQEVEQSSDQVKDERIANEKELAKVDTTQDENESNNKEADNKDKKDTEDKETDKEDKDKKETEEEDNEANDTDKEVDQPEPAAFTTTEEKSEEQPKNPDGITLQSAVVTRVVDGDTIKVEIEGKEETVRLILVDTPETKHPQMGVQPFGQEASDYTESALNGKEVGLEKDVSDRDRYGRLLRYVWVDGELFNQQLIEKGLARLAIYQPDVKYVEQFRTSQHKAQQEGIGIWSIENYAQEDGYRTQEEEAAPEEATEPQEKKEVPKTEPKEEPNDTSDSISDDCNIKGNISSSGEKIYHVPGGQFYEVTNPEEMFCSTSAAESAGYRASKR